MKNKFTALALIILLITMVFSGCKTSKTASSDQLAEAPTAVTVEKVSLKTVESVISLNGKIRPIKEIDIIPKVPGKVSKVNFDIGERVAENEVVFALDSSDMVLQLQSSEATLKISQSNYNVMKGGTTEQQMAQLDSAYKNAEVAYRDAKTYYERTKGLFDAGAVSKDILEKAENGLKVAQSNYDFSKLNYDVTKSKINPENIATAKAQLMQAQAAYNISKSQLDNSIVKSPIKGIVSARNIDEGEMVGSAAPAMSVIDISKVIVDVAVTEEIINKIKVGDVVSVFVNSIGDHLIQGTISNISPAADPKTQNYAVKIEIDNKDELLKGGMFAEIKFTVDKADNVLAVPISAVFDEDGKKFVYIVKDNTAYRKEVTLGFISNKLMQITSGLKENEVVIIKGQNFIQDGSKVNITQK